MKHKLVKVTWNDAKTEAGSIMSLKEVQQVKLVQVITIGYLIHENEERIAICSTCLVPEDDEYQDGFRDVHYIPKSWIIKIINLKEEKDEP